MKLADIKKLAKRRAKKNAPPTATYKNPYGGVGYGHDHHNHGSAPASAPDAGGGDGGGGGGE